MQYRLKRDLEFQEIPKEFKPNQFICRNICPIGHSIFKVQLPQSIKKQLLIQLPQKWKKKILFGRGDYCIATFPDKYNEMKDDEVLGNIDMLLTKLNLNQLRKQGKLIELGFETVEQKQINEQIPEVKDENEDIDVKNEENQQNQVQRLLEQLNDEESSASYY